MAGVYISLQMNEINNVKYEWTNKTYSVFPNEGPRVDMSYDTSSIPKSRVYEMYNI